MNGAIIDVFGAEITSASNAAIKGAVVEGALVGVANAANFGARGMMCIAGGLLVYHGESNPFPMLMSYMALTAVATAMYSVARQVR